MAEKVTIAKIAQACGTSIGTVDRALNKRSGISPKTRTLVLETAEKMGYKTNKLAGALSRRNSKRIAVIYPSAPEDFYSCMEKGIAKAAEDISIYGVEIESFRYGVKGAEDEKRVLQNLDAEKYDAIAIDPLHSDSAYFVDRFSALGKPVALFNNDLPDSSRLFFVGGAAAQSGRIGGDILGHLLCGSGCAAVLGNFINSMPFLGRFEGFCQSMERYYPGIQIKAGTDCRHDESITEENIKNFIGSCHSRLGIFCTSYSSTLSAIQALERLGRTDIALVGYDVSAHTSLAVKQGRCKALIYQDPYRQAYQVLELLSRHILEGWESPQKELFIPSRIAFRQNIEDFSDGIMLGDIQI